MTTNDPERQAIREAMTRLIDGHPVRSDGKLTIKSLADEADVKRWILTHKRLDLQDEFRARVQRHGRDPEPVRLLKLNVEKLTEENKRLRTELRAAKATCSMLDRLIAVHALEAQTRPLPGAPADTPRLRPVP